MSSMVSFTLATVSLICCSRSANWNGSWLGMVEFSGAGAARSLPVAIARKVPPTRPSTWMAATESVRISG